MQQELAWLGRARSMTGAGNKGIMCWVNDSYPVLVTGADPWAIKQAELGFPEDLDDALLILPNP